MSLSNKRILGEVILDSHNLQTTYAAVPMFTDGIYVLTIYGRVDPLSRELVRIHVEELHGIVVTCVSGEGL